MYIQNYTCYVQSKPLYFIRDAKSINYLHRLHTDIDIFKKSIARERINDDFNIFKTTQM